MATFDTTTVEGKIAAGLNAHRGRVSQTVLESLANTIAFVIRYERGLNVAANEVSVLSSEATIIKSGLGFFKGRRIMILVQTTSKYFKKVVSVTAEDGQCIVTALTTIINDTVQKIISLAGLDDDYFTTMVEDIKNT